MGLARMDHGGPRAAARAYGNPPSRASGTCILCRGTKMLCGKRRCPVLVRFYSAQATDDLRDRTELRGSSPPAVFIGRHGYPKVMVGPLIPPVVGDTSLLDVPERWYGRSMEEIVGFRSSLVRGMHPVNVTDVESRDRIVSLTRELALSAGPSDVDAAFTRPPRGRLALDDEVQPHGPSAPLRGIAIDELRMDDRIERAFYDTDLCAREAAVGLYRSGRYVSQIQKALSVGALGIGKRRRFVPTRWSITAVDSMLGEDIMERTKQRPTIDEYRIYESHHLDNRWAVLFMPSEWCYELIEAWYPDTAWNPFGKGIAIFSDYEFHAGRSDYAKIGGCYYAARLAANEKLESERRQAGVVIFREAHPGYIMPVGVWNVRENVRAALRTEPHRCQTLKEALDRVGSIMDIPLGRWIKCSGILKDRLYQKRLEEWA